MSHDQKPPRPSSAELALLKSLWKNAPLSAREIHDASLPELGWSFSSTRTTLKRMTEKDLIVTSKLHGVTVYTAGVSKVATLGAMMQDFMRRVIEVDGPLPVAAFHDSKLLSPEEICELEAILIPDEPANETVTDRATAPNKNGPAS